MSTEKSKVLKNCFMYVGIGALAGFVLPMLFCLIVFHGPTRGLIQVGLTAVCMPFFALIGLKRALNEWRAFVANGGN